MPSTYSASLRLTLQGTGEGNNVWGSVLNTGAIQLIDTAISGWTTKALTGNYSLTTASGAADEARSAMLKFTGAGTFTVTIPNVSKRYDVWNATTGVLTLTNGSVSVTLQVGEVVSIITDGSTGMKRVVPTDFGGAALTSVGSITGLATPTGSTQAASKGYVDGVAFTMAGGGLPGQIGSAGKFLTTDGSNASWSTITPANITGLSATASVVRLGTSTAEALTPGDTYNALAEVTLTYSATVTPDMSAFLNAVLTATGNFTLANPTNLKAGQRGRIRIVQDATGSRLLSAVGTSWKRDGGIPTLSIAANAQDFLVYEVITSTYIVYDLIRSPS